MAVAMKRPLEEGSVAAEGVRPQPSSSLIVREASPLEAYNTPLFEIPPMLDVRSSDAFSRSHIACAVSVPSSDGNDEQKLLQRIMEHDEEWGWCLQHPFFIISDDSTRARADWLAGVLERVVSVLGTGDDDEPEATGRGPAGRGQQLLGRLARMCKQVLLLRHEDFESNFPFCCASGEGFEASRLFEDLGPLPRCASLQPRVYLAGRQVSLTSRLLGTLGVSHAVVNADAMDVMDGTSGGGSTAFANLVERPDDVQGVRYLKCDVHDRPDGPEIPQVLLGAAQFLAACAAEQGVSLVRLHGQSRSASAVCAWLVASQGLSVEASWRRLEVDAAIKLDRHLVWWDSLHSLAASVASRALQDGQAEGRELVDQP